MALQTHQAVNAQRLGLIVGNDPRLDLRELVGDYCRWKRRRNISARQVDALEREILRVFDWLGVSRFGDLDRRGVERFLDHLDDRGRAARTLVKYQDNVKGLFNWAVNEGRIASNPLRGLKPRDGEKRRRRQVFSSEQMAAIDAAAVAGPAWQPLAVALGYHAAFRLREVRELQWGRVLFGSRELHLRPCDQKAKRESYVPIRSRLLEKLKVARAAAPDAPGSARVLPGMPEDPSRHQHALLRRAGVAYKDDLGNVGDFHAFRHTILTDMGKAGYQLAVIQDFARHKKPETTRIYVRENREGIRSALDAMPEFGGVIGGR